MDFYQIIEKTKTKKDNEGFDEIASVRLRPSFKVKYSKDIMVRGNSFYAIWDEERGLWSTDEFDVARLIDADMNRRRKSYTEAVLIDAMEDFASRSWIDYRAFLRQMPDSFQPLDDNLTFVNTEVKKTDYVSRRLPYPLEEGSCPAYEELMTTLYEPDELNKLEWAVGAIVAGEAKNIQKFVVLYGEAGSGKSTFLNILEKLFEGYYTMFEAKALTSSSNAFSTEVFRNNPLVAIQHDGDLSRIEDNSKLNSIVAHELMTMNEKYKAAYTARTNCFLFMGTNKPVRITDSKSGVIRRLIDVTPSGRLVPVKKYHILINQINFELGAIAWRCLQAYLRLGKNYYSGYRPLTMMYQTDTFFNFVEANYHTFKEQDGVALVQAYAMYKTYCEEALIEYRLPRHKFRDELKSYFEDFKERSRVDGREVRSYYIGFKMVKFVAEEMIEEKPLSLVIEQEESNFDKLFADCPAQYANDEGTPIARWDEVKTNLANINPRRLHYVKPPEDHIVIDFDLTDGDGNKSLMLNLEAASKWPVTYAEYSKSGTGIHLHYVYDGDTNRLSRVYSEGIEIKVFTGKASLRRKLTMCNNAPILTINSGLPLKGEKMINVDVVNDEKHLRALITKALKKEIHPGTKSNVDFMQKILDDAYNTGVRYDVTDLRPKILAFANNSSNQSETAIKIVNKMHFASEVISEPMESEFDELLFYDVEVFPNLLVVVWKTTDKPAVTMINPSSEDIGRLLQFKLVGFNCRRYDNHILYARYIGYDLAQIYDLSQKIVNGSKNCFFGEAYNLSYTDIYDFSSVKQGLKKWEIELGIHHQELGLPWDEPVPEEKWQLVADYCINDVVATEAVFYAREADFTARQILSDLSGLSVNDTTQNHIARFLFGTDPRPQEKFVYTDLSTLFPGYTHDRGKSIYRDIEVGEGGFVHAMPGMYTHVYEYDIASQHPTSLVELNLFGPYTEKFKKVLDGRIGIKHDDLELVATILDGVFAKYISDDTGMKKLAYALKIVLNSVYGYTKQNFDSKFTVPGNKDNIVAKRGALFMIELMHQVTERGGKVIHIKTDSIKIVNPTEELKQFIFEFGKKYGYTFEHEKTYSKFCLLNDAVYVGKEKNKWYAIGTQMIHPYVFKTLFKDGYVTGRGIPCFGPINFKDLCETKTVTTALYLDMNEDLPEGEHSYRLIGKVGSFCPIYPNHGGGILLREKDGKYNAATGSKGYRWLEEAMVKTLEKENSIDFGYFNALVDDAIAALKKFGDVEWFLAMEDDNVPPWCAHGCPPGCIKDCGNCKLIGSGEGLTLTV